MPAGASVAARHGMTASFVAAYTTEHVDNATRNDFGEGTGIAHHFGTARREDQTASAEGSLAGSASACCTAWKSVDDIGQPP